MPWMWHTINERRPVSRATRDGEARRVLILRRAMIIRSKLDQLSAVKEWLRLVVVHAGLGPREAFDMTLAVHEAVVNAILHGNGKDPRKRVEIAHACQNGALVVCVKDEGRGFDVQRGLQRAREQPCPTSPCGRGLLLMTSLADEVTYNDAGNEVRLTKLIKRKD
jgi:serine/threonine-protein kinase RsbW